MNRDSWILVGIASGATLASLACYEYNTIKARQLEEKKAENEKLYFSKLTPEMVKGIEEKKLDLKRAEIELKKTEDELKKTVTDFKNEIQTEIEKETMTKIHDDMRSTFDDWSSKFENRLDSKVDRVISRIDDLSDKYGGVKGTGASAPTISVVNAPNN